MLEAMRNTEEWSEVDLMGELINLIDMTAAMFGVAIKWGKLFERYLYSVQYEDAIDKATIPVTTNLNVEKLRDWGYMTNISEFGVKMKFWENKCLSMEEKRYEWIKERGTR